MTSSDRKTKPTDAGVDAFLDSVDDPKRKADAIAATQLIREVTQTEPKMWGPTMVGFGNMPYKTADGKQHEYFAVGLSPRKAALTLYGLTYYGSNVELLERMGKHKLGKGCVYVNKLSDIDLDVLRELVDKAWSTNHVG